MTKKKYTIVDLFPPGFTTINGKKYLLPGWIQVDDDITLSDVEHIKPLKKNVQEFIVKGSKGNLYTVKKRGNSFICDCPAGKFRGICKHMNKIKTELDLV
jgi:hypothetical protein